MTEIGKMLIGAGVMLVVLGLLWNYIPFFRLPGDFTFRRDNFIFSFPLVTSIILSILLTLLLNFFLRK